MGPLAVTLYGVLLAGAAAGAWESPGEALSGLRLYNPTSWDGPVPIEIPTGHLAAPGLIDWSRVRLRTADGREVPYALREGRPHWKARLTAPIASPRAEDLLVFPIALPPREWVRIDVVSGPGPGRQAVSVREDTLVVSYPDIEVTIGRSTGMLIQAVASGERFLEAPMTAAFRRSGPEGSASSPLGPPRVRLAAQSSTPAMTEIHFVLDADDRLAIALTYRIHACGLLEVLADERPWEGTSPWVDRAAEFRLPLAGQAETLPTLVNRAPYYGFKDYARKHPEAMAPGNDRCPCFSHPLYAAYLEGFLKEVLETYPIDGLVMIRDDNGGLCGCGRCAAYVARSPTRSAAWEQYLILHRWMRSAGFRGDLAVYPYFDAYDPRLDPLLPPDLLIVGHGSGAGMLSRSYETLAPMGDTWLDNVIAGFRVPTAPRMRRLLSDRNSFWLGGALRGSELPWQAIGGFGWEPTATVNSLRYGWGARRFGAKHALAYADMAQAYEQAWEINDLALLPQEWVRLRAEERGEIAGRCRSHLLRFRGRLEDLRRAVGRDQGDPWFSHLTLIATYIEYHLRRLELFSRMRGLVADHRKALEQAEALPEPIRSELLSMHAEVYALAEAFDREAAAVPGTMIARTRALGLTLPFKEFVTGYDASLEGLLETRQFAGTLEIRPEGLAAGRPFTLRVRLVNAGIIPWTAGMGLRLELEGGAERLGLPARWEFEPPPMVFGDRREIELKGTAPAESGKAALRLSLHAPFRNPILIAKEDVGLLWE